MEAQRQPPSSSGCRKCTGSNPTLRMIGTKIGVSKLSTRMVLSNSSPARKQAQEDDGNDQSAGWQNAVQQDAGHLLRQLHEDDRERPIIPDIRMMSMKSGPMSGYGLGQRARRIAPKLSVRWRETPTATA